MGAKHIGAPQAARHKPVQPCTHKKAGRSPLVWSPGPLSLARPGSAQLQSNQLNSPICDCR